eukprot:scaffold47392_cov60-Phaeocystis_antarctica.AAC.2
MVHASHSHRWHENSQPSPQPCTSMAAPTTSSGTAGSSRATASPWGILGGAATSWAPVAGARQQNAPCALTCRSHAHRQNKARWGRQQQRRKTCQQRASRLLRDRL